LPFFGFPEAAELSFESNEWRLMAGETEADGVGKTHSLSAN
jgi:hypothetical protein